MMEDLERLSELRSRGALTDEEFQAAKDELFASTPASQGPVRESFFRRLQRSDSAGEIMLAAGKFLAFFFVLAGRPLPLAANVSCSVNGCSFRMS